nr:hypothetical protein [uncultured Methanoregula sp.]
MIEHPGTTNYPFALRRRSREPVPSPELRFMHPEDRQALTAWVAAKVLQEEARGQHPSPGSRTGSGQPPAFSSHPQRGMDTGILKNP